MKKENTQVVIPYLILPQAKNFYDFVKNVFGGQETHRFLHADQSLMHGQVNIGSSSIMFADSNNQLPPQPAGLYILVDNADETFKKAIDNGSTVIMELADKDYGRTCGVRDPFGNTWWITTELN
jgi:uncharacterized glyoxalase superfamily protein PhnB